MINLPIRTANRLAKLHNELSIVSPVKFDQDDCHACVIGHAIRQGACNGYRNPHEDFIEALTWVGIPNGRQHNDIENYLFGTAGEIRNAAEWLRFPIPKAFGVKDAQKRIEKILDEAGYELV